MQVIKCHLWVIILSVEHLFHSARWKIMINISWIRWHIYNFVVCKYNDNKQSESELLLMQNRY